jgi:hypothetical protein
VDKVHSGKGKKTTIDEEIQALWRYFGTPEGRQWDDTAKAWWFAEDYLAEACRVAPGLEQYTAQSPLL